MTKSELQQCLSRLDLSAVEAAQLLGVTPRTVRRWLEGEEVRGPAEQAVRAWIKLHDRHLPWRPDSASIKDNNEGQIALHRQNAIDLADLMARVDARGGPRLSSWAVDRGRGRASFGPIEVTFYKLANGSFALGYYTRKDGDPDVQRDAEIIEDAAYCIAQSLRKEPDFGPVTLVVNDGSAKGRISTQRLEKFNTNRAAIARACKAFGSPGFHKPFIMTDSPGELLWDAHDLRQECERRIKAPIALRELADYLRANSAFLVASGAQVSTAAAQLQRLQRIEAIAKMFYGLAEKAGEGFADYQEFDRILGELHAAGLFPEGEYVSVVKEILVSH